MPLSSAVVVAQCHLISSRLLQGLIRSTSLAAAGFNVVTSRGLGGVFWESEVDGVIDMGLRDPWPPDFAHCWLSEVDPLQSFVTGLSVSALQRERPSDSFCLTHSVGQERSLGAPTCIMKRRSSGPVPTTVLSEYAP